MSKDREFVIKGNYGGYYNDNGLFVVCEEYGLTDADTDKYAVEVMNGEGYYNSEGRFVRFRHDECASRRRATLDERKFWKRLVILFFSLRW